MKITALEEYGLRCMIQLARNGANGSLTLPEFTRKEGLSVAYAGKLLMILKKAGLVKAARGRKGGYNLTKPAKDISLKEIFEALGDRLFPSVYCEAHGGNYKMCLNNEDCRIKDIWQSVDTFFDNLFDKITLADIADGNLELLHSMTSMNAVNEESNDKNAVLTE